VSEWLTYAQGGARFGVSAEAFRQMALRRKWSRRRTNNDPYGPALVLVPDDVEVRARTPVGRVNERLDERPSDTRSSGELDTLREAVGTLREQLDRERSRADQAEARADRAERRADDAMARADHVEVRAEAARERAEAAGIHVEQLKRILREAETGLTAERAGKATAEAALARALDAQTKAEAKAIEAEAAAAEAAQLRQAMEQAVRETEALRAAEVARAAAQAMEPTDRPAMVASKIDEVQFRRLQEAEQARKSLGLVARLKAAWRGE
jgi:chromosome segregation ATPase